MRKLYFSVFLFLCAFTKIHAQNVNVTSTAGTPNGSYATLKAAFDAINAGTHQGMITVDVIASTTETATAALNGSGTGSAAYSSILVKPTAAVTISGNLAGPLVDLFGADGVTIDGRIGAAGSTRSLTISNLSAGNTAGTSTVRFINDASNNTLNFINLLGSSTTATGAATGTILIDSSTVATGNDNIVISNNDIGAAVTTPWCAIYSIGESATLDNNNISVLTNSIHDFFATSGLSTGMLVDAFSTAWTISNNSFYQSVSRTSTAAITHLGIYVNAGNGHTISGNFIGGSGSLAGGAPYTLTGAFANYFACLFLAVGTTTATNVNGNTIANISMSAQPTSNSFMFNGIRTTSGNVNIGTVSGNTIGALSGTGSITINSTATSNTITGFVEAIITAGGNIDIRNNVIGSFTITGISTAATTFRAIETSSPTALNIQSNTLGGPTAGSIQSNTPSGSVIGVLNFQGVTGLNYTVTGNTIQNMVNNASGTNTASITAIQNQLNLNSITITNTITNNIITNLSSTASSATLGSISGIVVTVGGTITGSTSDGNINNNQINNLTSASTAASTSVRAISNANSYNNFLNINGNQIHTLSTPAPNTASTSVGVVQAITSSTSGVGSLSVSNNTIYNLENTSSVASHVIGIGVFYGSTTNTATLSANRIYNLRNPNAAATGLVSGVVLRGAGSAGTFAAINNMISLAPANVQVYGIHNNSQATVINTYYNSIVISGTGAGTNNSGAFFRNGAAVTTAINLRNNILYNTRTGGGSHYAVLNNATAPATGWTSDFNNLYTTNSATVALWGAANNDLATYKTNAGDANSKSFVVNFVDASNGDLHLSGASIGDFNLEGNPIAGVTTDYDGQTRNDDPYIGADEVVTAPLPLTMDFFSGRKQTTSNLLSWKASCSSSSITFEIERSSDGRRFSSIGRITATKERCESAFNYTDASPASGMNYYRLKMTENDGALKYSAIIAILNKTTGFELVGLYPTAIQSIGTLSVTAANKTSLQLMITDLSGRTMIQKLIAVTEGSALLQLDLSNLAKGVYHLTGTTPEGYEKTIRFVKQ